MNFVPKVLIEVTCYFVFVLFLYRLYKLCPEVIQPYNMKNKDIYGRRYKIQETLYRGQ